MNTPVPPTATPTALDLLRGAWLRYNRRFATLLALAILFFACFFVLYVLAYVSLSLSTYARVSIGNVLTLSIFLVALILAIGFSAWQQGAWFQALDRAQTFTAAVRQSWRRIGPMMGAYTCLAILSGGPLLITYAWAAWRLSGVTTPAHLQSAILSHAVTAIPVVAATIWSLGIWLMWMFAPPLVMIEKMPVWAALRKSWLIAAKRWWKLLWYNGIFLLVLLPPVFLLSLVPYVGPLALALLVPPLQSAFLVELWRMAYPKQEQPTSPGQPS